MKKLILTLAIGVFFIAFSNAQSTLSVAKKATKTECATKKGDTVTVYQCPMDCEKGKVYKKEGKCPKCSMELKAVKKSCADKKAKGCCSGNKTKKSCEGKTKKSCADKKTKSSCAGKTKKSCADKKAKSSCADKKK